MTGRLAWEAVESMVADERRRAEGSDREDPCGEEALRLIATLWEWAAGRELETASAR
jgi:hypothetical protein